MNVIVSITNNFAKAAKPLLKKYPSLSNDLLQLEKELKTNPRSGTALGNNIYKIRIAISSKGKGKSGGARVISFVETIIIQQVNNDNEELVVNLITIYDKSDTATISDKELKELIKAYYRDKES